MTPKTIMLKQGETLAALYAKAVKERRYKDANRLYHMLLHSQLKT